MQDIRTILRLTHEQDLSIRQIGLRLKLSKTTVATYLLRAREAGLNGWPLPPGRNDNTTLEVALFQRMGRPPQDIKEPDWAKVTTELKRKGHPGASVAGIPLRPPRGLRVYVVL